MKNTIFALIAFLLLAVNVQAGRWRSLGLAGCQVLSLETNPADTQYIYAGTNYGTYVSDNGGAMWVSIMPTNVRIPFLGYSPFSPDTLWKLIGSNSNSDGLYYSINGGIIWNLVCYLVNPQRLGFDPVDTGFIYICLSDGILTSQQSGQSVAPANTGLPSTNTLDVIGDGRNNLEAYVVGQTFVAHTVDFGNHWTSMGGLFGLENYNPQRIIHDPVCTDTLYVTCYAYVAVSTNGGISWNYTPMNDADFLPIESDPRVTGRIFVGSLAGGGVFESTDGGASFNAINDSLGNLNVYSLKFTSAGKLLAGTDNGVYIYDFSVGIDDNHPNIPDGFALAQNYPNPFNNQTIIEFSSPSDERASLMLYDIAGRLVRHLYSGNAKDIVSVTWDGKNDEGQPVTSGIYLYRLQMADNTAIRKLSYLR